MKGIREIPGRDNVPRLSFVRKFFSKSSDALCCSKSRLDRYRMKKILNTSWSIMDKHIASQ